MNENQEIKDIIWTSLKALIPEKYRSPYTLALI